MEKSFILFLIAILPGNILLTAGCMEKPTDITNTTTGNIDPPHEATYTSIDTLVAFVDSAAVHVKTQGREKALAEFNNPNGSFIHGEHYIYAYDFNGTTLAHPVNPEKVGKNRLDEGETGIYVKEMEDIVRSGSGYYRF